MGAAANGELEEAFGTGTAAVISPIGELFYNGKAYTVNDFKIGPVAQKLYDELTGIQWGKRPDPFGWTECV
jgi:branched-chain amino acid aminotransferase